ncbi:caspase family protein [Dokdonella koreensis]|uniref:caspase family protein n=1 Tax=Dokdonella koreensis TaxID=323415 RepID=UPI00123770E8|nr:caspase family protein [Dokdonella koreensis]
MDGSGAWTSGQYTRRANEVPETRLKNRCRTLKKAGRAGEGPAARATVASADRLLNPGAVCCLLHAIAITGCEDRDGIRAPWPERAVPPGLFRFFAVSDALRRWRAPRGVADGVRRPVRSARHRPPGTACIRRPRSRRPWLLPGRDAVVKKAAVVIGVDRTGGGLTPLKAAAACAAEVAAWLEQEGYAVTLVNDADGEPVTAARVTAAIRAFVTVPPRFEQLLVYFSGHGYWQARSDVWLLSGAPESTQEAINLEGSIYVARRSGIPNIVFVSDACRSIPDARTGALVNGIDVFPNFADVDAVSKIDVFKSTVDAQPAYEATLDGKPRSVLTHALLKAFEAPTPDMLLQVQEAGATITVVPNRRLERYLQDTVEDTLAAINIDLVQQIEATVPSDDRVYIARVRTPAAPVPDAPRAGGTGGVAIIPPSPSPSAGRAPSPAVRGRKGLFSRRPSVPPLQPPPPPPRPSHLVRMRLPARQAAGAIERVLAGAPPLAAAGSAAPALALRAPSGPVDHMETGCGFSIRGAVVAEALCTRRHGAARTELLAPGDGGDAVGIVRLHLAAPGESVLLRFADGRGAIVAALAGFIGHVAVEAEGVANVSYVPSSNTARWPAYAERRESLDRLRAWVALAADRRTFRLRSVEEAAGLADQIRIDKALDPTLGLYAVHAYTQAGDIARARDVALHLREDLGAELFDVRVLTAPAADPSPPLLPFCPLLTQTWSLVRPSGMALGPVLAEASGYLCDSLWTTFEPQGADLLRDAMEQGRLA